MKISDYEDNERRRIQSEIEVFADTIKESQKTRPKDTSLGLCNECAALNMSKTLYGKTFAKCSNWEVSLSGKDPITYCNMFSKEGQMDTWDMKEIAYIIDVKREIGFVK